MPAAEVPAVLRANTNATIISLFMFVMRSSNRLG
jgi:hypothetical protein